MAQIYMRGVVVNCLQVGVGNHEIEMSDVTNEVFRPYKTRFAMPHTKAGVGE